MRFIDFAVTQDGGIIGNFTRKERAVAAARQYAMDTGRPVTVVASVEGGGTKANTPLHITLRLQRS